MIIRTVPVIIIETKVPVELALFLQSTMASTWEFYIEAIVDWRKSASYTGTFVSIIMTGTVPRTLQNDSSPVHALHIQL